MLPPVDPRSAHVARLEASRATREAAWAQVRTLGTARLVVFLVFVALAWLVTERHALAGAWLWIPFAAFIALVLRHREVLARHEQARRAVSFHDDALHRLDDAWIGRGVEGTRFIDPAHPYSGDLDLFGPGSLFELLCGARTAAGEACLARWLCAPADLDTVRERQRAVDELRGRLALREALATVCDARGVIDGERLTRWGDRELTLTSPVTRIVAAVLGGLSFAALLAWGAGLDARPFLALFALGQLFALWPREAVSQVTRGIDGPRHDLSLLADFLACIEGERVASPLLQSLWQRLEGQPSVRLRALITRMEYAEAMRNIFFAPFGVVLLWSTQVACAIEAWRARDGARVGVWVEVLGEIEALLSLAALAFESPADVFPELEKSGPVFDGAGLAHPLLPRARAVPNDVRLDGGMQLMLVSGSNMAGKSSLLRTVGVNTVLALAGGTVRATSLRISLLAVGACMRIHDSLQQGVSHFYAEITRLRHIVDLAGQPERPLLFLLDEILHGTNSHDRRIGAEAVVRSLIARGALGLVTTHDLALTGIVEALAPRAINVHLQDEMIDGVMRFDYTLRAGVVEHSNAVALMRAVGLDV